MFQELEEALMKCDDIKEALKTAEVNAAINKIVLGAIAGMMSKLSANAKYLLARSVTNHIPEKYEVLAISAPQSISDDIMNTPRKDFYFTADFLQNLPEYMRFLHHVN